MAYDDSTAWFRVQHCLNETSEANWKKQTLINDQQENPQLNVKRNHSHCNHLIVV